MAVGALIGAYQEDDSGGLRALLPLAGEALLDFQARSVAAAGAAPIIVYVERIPPALQLAFERLRRDGIVIVAVSDAAEAASRFEAGSDILLLADGVAPDVDDIAKLMDTDEPRILTVADDESHQAFERIDGNRRWAGLARLDAGLVGATAAMLGDWDMQSTLLRRAVQAGVALEGAHTGEGRGPFLAENGDAMIRFERQLLVASRGQREDAIAHFLLPIVEEAATEKLMETRLRPAALLWSAFGLTLAAAFCFTRGWAIAAVGLLVLSTPLDLVAKRLALLRMRPLAPKHLAQTALWPSAGLALLALGWFEARHGSGWGSMVAAIAAAAFAEAARIERNGLDQPGGRWLFSRRNAIFLAVPFLFLERWPIYLCLIALYAAVSFYLVQHVRHGLGQSPQR